MQIKIQSILKVVLFESLAGNDFSEQGTQAEAIKVLDEKHRMIAVQGILVGNVIKASGANLKVTDLLFAVC